MTTFLLPTTSDNENYDECNYAVVDLDRKALKRISDRVGAAVKLRKAFQDLNHQSYWDDIEFHYLNDNQIKKIKKERLVKMVDDIIILAGSKATSAIPADSYVRTDCMQMCIRPAKSKKYSSIYWMAYDHYSSTKIESASLTLEAFTNLVASKTRKLKKRKEQ